MSVSRIWALIKKLNKLSVDGKLDWQITAEDGVYQVAFPNNSVEILERATGYNDNRECILRLLNQEGSVIEETSDETLAQHLPKQGEAWRMLHGLFSLARSRALGVDAALDSLMDSLEALDPDVAKPETGSLTDDDVPF